MIAIYVWFGIPTTIKTMGVNITTIAYLRVLIIEIGSNIIFMIFMLVETQGMYIYIHIMIYLYNFDTYHICFFCSKFYPVLTPKNHPRCWTKQGQWGTPLGSGGQGSIRVFPWKKKWENDPQLFCPFPSGKNLLKKNPLAWDFFAFSNVHAMSWIIIQDACTAETPLIFVAVCHPFSPPTSPPNGCPWRVAPDNQSSNPGILHRDALR